MSRQSKHEVFLDFYGTIQKVKHEKDIAIRNHNRNLRRNKRQVWLLSTKTRILSLFYFCTYFAKGLRYPVRFRY